MNQEVRGKISPLDATELAPDLSAFQITLSDELPATNSIIGQDRAKKAIEFGLGVQAPGYNLYLMGEQATGRHTLVRQLVEKQSAHSKVPDDCVYLNNFSDERFPIALKLQAGQAKTLVQDIQMLLEDVLDTFPEAFDNPSYQRKKSAITKANQAKYNAAISEIEALAMAQNISLVEDEDSLSFVPIVDGKPLNDSEFLQLDELSQKTFLAHIEALEERLNEALLEVPQWQRQSAEKLRKLKRETAQSGLKPLFKSLEHRYANNLALVSHIKKMKSHLVDSVVELFAEQNKDDKSDDLDHAAILTDSYLPNILVAHDIHAGAPLVYETQPTYHNLFGKIEYTSVQGSVYTNYQMITAGALHRANGGYLVIDADKLLRQPMAWEALKLALKNAKLKIDTSQSEYGMVNSVAQEPQAFDLSVKVLLLGSRELYYDLQEADEEFDELFKVLVDFDPELHLNQKQVTEFVQQARLHALQAGFTELTECALRRLLTYSLRLAEHQSKLSAHFADVIELVYESAYYANQQSQLILDAQIIETAIHARTERTSRVSLSLLEEIQEGHVLIQTEGLAIGKVNGLTVLDVGNTAFGTPARITATVYAGANGVIDIEREVELGQSIHSKGVLLLNGYLGHKYAQHFPLTLSANIALEQSYGYVDGDSASLGELIALISALTEIPVDQGIAITGSINQYGEVQAVGGVNEKIEGFFDLCDSRGLTGRQGVVIPQSNTLNLVLHQRVIKAVKQGQFFLYSVASVDQALEVLMSRQAGIMSSRGRYPKNTIHYHALNRLYNIANIVNGASDDD